MINLNRKCAVCNVHGFSFVATTGLATPERKRKRFRSRRHWQLGSVPILPRFASEIAFTLAWLDHTTADVNRHTLLPLHMKQFHSVGKFHVFFGRNKLILSFEDKGHLASVVLLNVIILVYNFRNRIIVVERISGRKLEIMMTGRSGNCPMWGRFP